MALPSYTGNEVLVAQAHIWNHIFSFMKSMSLKCAIQLGIPDIIHSHGRAMTLSDLVNFLPINKAKGQDYIYRLMRILIHAGFFIQDEEGYLLTPTSRLLLKDEPMSVTPFLQMILDPIMMDPWKYLSKWFQNGGSSPFIIAHGEPLFEYTKKESQFNNLFNIAMSTDSQLVANVMIEHCKGVFEGLTSLVDVGGGNGALTKAFADAFPQINFTVFDLPHVIEGLEGCKNLSYVGGNMFKSIPSADAITLKWILHDWKDEECIQILKKCKEAIPSKENGGRVIIIDMVLMDHNPVKGDHKSYETQLLFDMLMMVDVSGKERSEQEWEKLFFNAGFTDYNIIPILGLRSVIEWILHDWNGEECIQILKKCKEAVPSKENGGRVVIIEIVLMDHNLVKGDHKSYETQLLLDMLLMVDFAGKERSEQEWAKLFFDAGFSDYNIIPILGFRSVIEVYP